MQVFPNGIQGLSDSKFAGVQGSAYRLVGIDYRSTPGLTKVQQKLAKASSTVVTELCKEALAVSDGSTLWFSSESGKIWREVSGTFTLVHTTAPTDGDAACTGAHEYDGDVYWATEKWLHKIRVSAINGTWADSIQQNFGEFREGVREHPMAIQNLQLFIGDGANIGKVETPVIDPYPPTDATVSFSSSVFSLCISLLLRPSNIYKFAEYQSAERWSASVGGGISASLTVEPGADRLLAVVVSTWRTDGAAPETVTAASFDGDPLTVSYSQAYNFSFGPPNLYMRTTVLYLANPNVTTGTLSVTLSDIDTHLVVHAYVFNGAYQDGDPFAFKFPNNQTHTSITAYIPDNSAISPTDFPYHTLVAFTRSQTATHTSSETEILDDTNTLGRDSAMVHTVGGGAYTQTSALRLRDPEYISSLEPFDVDLLVGTKADNVNKSRVLRWDTENSGFSADDTVDEYGINGFIRDDNFVYVSAGEYGRIYFYDGEKLLPFSRIPGEWSPTKKATIYRNAVAFHMGIPVFGVSNVTGNPTLQGVYGLGKYSKDYDPTMSLDFPISPDVFDGVTIGAIVVQGANLYVAWKTASSQGVDKLDWSNKYTNAYIETPILTPLDARSVLKTLQEAWVDYYSLPTDTNVTIKAKTNHGGSFQTLTTRSDEKLQQLSARETMKDVSALQLRYDFTVSDNDAPEIESFGYRMSARDQR